MFIMKKILLRFLYGIATLWTFLVLEQVNYHLKIIKMLLSSEFRPQIQNNTIEKVFFAL